MAERASEHANDRSRMMAGMTDTQQLLEELFGPVLDAELVLKSMPDQADVHVNVAEQRRRRTQARAALASNAFGATMGGLAIKDAVQVARTKAHTPGVPRKAKYAAAAIAAGQLLNAGGDVNSMVVTGREASRKLSPTGRKREVAAKRAPGLHPEIKNLAQKVVQFWKPVTAPPPPPAAPKAAAAGAAPKTYAGAPQTRKGVKDARKAAAETTQRRQTAERSSAAGTDVARMLGTKSGKAAAGTLALTGANKVTGGRNRGYEYVPDTIAYGKADDGIEFRGEFTKFDDAKRQAFGWASVVTKDGSPVLDRQGDYISIEDLETAAYTYVHKSRVGGDMHKRDGDAPHHVSDMIESMVFTPEKIAKMGLPEGFPEGWWVGYQIHDEATWQEVRKKGRTGFSIHGRGIRKDVDIDELMGAR